jgi:hypothetical protein
MKALQKIYLSPSRLNRFAKWKIDLSCDTVIRLLAVPPWNRISIPGREIDYSLHHYV